MGLKNTQEIRTIGQLMAQALHKIGEKKLALDWTNAVNHYENLMQKRRDIKKRKHDAKRFAKARGENKN